MAAELTITLRPTTPPRDWSLIYVTSYATNRENAILNRVLPGDSVIDAARMLMVWCPKCRAKRGQWCRYPNGRQAQVMHVARWRRSIAQGWWGHVTLPVPEIIKESR